jgi:DNA-binding IclR family transcriptional regulator
MPITVQTPKEATKQIESVEKALNILECFSSDSPELSLKQLSEKTGLYKSRILRLCGTLESHGFLIRSQKSVYSLGPKLLMLGKVYERANSFISLSRPILRELASLTGESTKLFVIQGRKRICLAREEGSYPLRYAVREGEAFDLYAGASGKLLLAYSSEEFRDSILNQTLKRITPATFVERKSLEREFEKIRELGYATSKGEVVPEVAGIAAPVFDYTGEIAAALTVAGPIQRFAGEHFTQMCKLLLESARNLSHLMGYKG